MRKEFKIARSFIIANYAMIPFLFLMALFFLYRVLFNRQSLDAANSQTSFLFFVAAIAAIAAGIYCIRILPRLSDKTILTDSGIRCEHSDGSVTEILWEENYNIKQRIFLGRIEISSSDGQRTILLENQLENFQDLVKLLNAKSAAKRAKASQMNERG